MTSKKLKFLIIATLVTTVVIAAAAYALTHDYDGRTKTGLYFRAQKLTDVPQQYWNLTDPDPYVLAAINNLTTWIFVNQTTQTFLKQLSQHNDIDIVCYNGTFYDIDVIFIDLWRKPTQTSPSP